MNMGQNERRLLIENEKLRDEYASSEQRSNVLRSALRYIADHPNGVGDHAPHVVALNVLRGGKVPTL